MFLNFCNIFVISVFSFSFSWVSICVSEFSVICIHCPPLPFPSPGVLMILLKFHLGHPAADDPRVIQLMAMWGKDTRERRPTGVV